MKYLKYTFLIMLASITLSFFKTDAIGIGSLTIDPHGNTETPEYQKQTSEPQYARKRSCYGVLTGIDHDVQARTHMASHPSTYGDWTKLGTTDTKLKGGDETREPLYYYKLNLQPISSLESCYFVGHWTYN